MKEPTQHKFKAEVQQLLDIVIHSLYTDRDIFIRELISNASDALEKLRYLQSSGQAVEQPELDLEISITADEKQNKIIISDTGIGMSESEIEENLGRIAHSGSKSFLQQLEGDKKPDANLIGQFGVGFYSAFMVAKSVTVLSQSYRSGETGVEWNSEGAGVYSIKPAGDLPRGTRIILDLMDDQKTFAQPGKLEMLVKRYSRFVPFPIKLDGTQLNTVQALWTRSKNEIKPEEYEEFYNYIAHDSEAPLYRLHFTADAPLAIQAVLFVPAKNWESMGLNRVESEVSLYCRKVLIQSPAKGLLPDWLRFLKGVVDSEDLPLNISRETMQDTALINKLNKVLTTRFLKFLDEQAKKDPSAFLGFFEKFGKFIKEGIVTDYSHKDALGKLLRYPSSIAQDDQPASLAEYVSRMPDEQKDIYYVMGPNRSSVETSPYLEALQAKSYEVLYLYDPWDEFVMDHLSLFSEKKLVSAEKADITLDKPANEKPDAEHLKEEETKELVTWLKEVLGDRVGEVRVSQRLVDSPAVVVGGDSTMTASMRKIMEQVKGDVPASKQDLEINPNHRMMTRLDHTRRENNELAVKVTEQIFDNCLAAAGLLEDTRPMVKRLNDLMEEILDTKR